MYLLVLATIGFVFGLLLSFPQSLNGQQCGGSTYRFSVFVRNGTEAKNLRYRVYSLGRQESQVQKEAIKILFPYVDVSKYVHLSEINKEIEKERAEAFTRNYRETEYVHPHLEDPLQKKNRLSGRIIGGRFQFSTRETDVTPYLLAVKADNKLTHYRIDNLFGGCFRGSNILLYDKVN